MKRFFEPILPFLFPFILSLLPFLGLYFEDYQRKVFDFEQKTRRWKQTAANLIQEIRIESSFDGQINRFAFRLRRRFSQITDLDRSKFSSLLLELYHRIFPSSHRPPGTLIYGFAADESGRLNLIREQGFAQEKGRILLDLMKQLINAPSLSREERATLSKRVNGIFGENLNFDLLAVDRKGTITLAEFCGKPSLIIWNTLEHRKKLDGAYLIVLPISAEQQANPLTFTLQKKFRQAPGFIPILVPLQGEPPRIRPIIPGKIPVPRGFKKELTMLRNLPDREKSLPLGQLCFGGSGYWMQRDLLTTDQHYEIWIISQSPASARTQATSLMILLGIIIGGVWLGVLSTSLINGRPPPVSMRFWMMSFLAFLSIISLTSLYIFGTYYIETSAIRQTQENIKTFSDQLGKIESGVARIINSHTETFRRLMFNHEWCNLLLKSTPDEKKRLLHEMVRALGRKNPPIFLNHVYLYQYGRILTKEAFPSTPAKAMIGRYTMDLLDPLVQGSATEFQSGIASLTTPTKAGETDKGFSRLVISTLDRRALINFMILRQKTDLLGSGGDDHLLFYDFLTQNGRIIATIVFLASVQEAYDQYLFQAINNKDYKSPGQQMAFGPIEKGGFNPRFPRTGKFWNHAHGRKVRRLMDLSVQTATDQILQEESFAFVSHFCTFAKGFVLGGTLSLETVKEAAELQRSNLTALILVLMALMMILGYLTFDHLLVPLREVETGLRQVSEGNLEVRLNLNRNDELGDLSHAFDQMIRGIQERRELGLFVSRQLDVGISQASSSKGSDEGKKTGSVLACDLRNFTTLSETHPPRDIVAMLNFHHHSMAEIIQSHGGMVELFVGDAVIAVFPEAQEGQSALMATEAAIAMTKRHRLNQMERSRNGDFTYEMGIGIDRGMIVSGTIGTSSRLEFTVLGKPRTRAEALEILSKKGTMSRIIVSSAVASFCPVFSFAPLHGEEALELAMEIPPL